MRKLWFLLALLIAATGAILSVHGACTAEDDEEEEEDDTTLVDIKVLHDDLFGLADEEVIGQIEFGPDSGQVGVLVTARVWLETLSRFPDQQITMRLELQNQDAARESYEAIEWTQDTNVEDIEFVVPLVETIPVMLNFRVLAYDYRYDKRASLAADDDDATPADDDDDNDDDDASPADDDDNDADDDDNDASPEPTRLFEAEGILLFMVDEGQPGAGD